MRTVITAVAFAVLASSAPAYAGDVGQGRLTHGGKVVVGIEVAAPGTGAPGHAGDGAARPMVHYLVSWSVDPTPAQTGSLNGLCAAPGGTAQQPVFGFLYHLVGTDATGRIVDDRFECIAFPGGDPTRRPPAPAVPAVPTLGEAWKHAQIPAPPVTIDPASRGITGLDTRISTSGPATVVIAATVRGYTITGVATLDHYEISIDGRPATNAGTGHYTFETKGIHTIAISAVWSGAAALAGPGLPAVLPAVDLGIATIIATRTYPVNEIRSVLQP